MFNRFDSAILADHVKAHDVFIQMIQGNQQTGPALNKVGEESIA